MQAKSLTHYFRKSIDGDDIVERPVSWGRSTIYFETSEEGFVIRQIQMFESGLVLAYNDSHYHDSEGWRWEIDIRQDDPPGTIPISSKEFHKAWLRHAEAKNRDPTPGNVPLH